MSIKGILIFLFYRALMTTWKIRIVEDPGVREWIEDRNPTILAHWHGDEYSLYHMVKTYRLATMVSTSKDGNLVDTVIRLMGGETTRGSSTRGGASALKGLIRILRSGRTTSLAVDGPRGPYHEVKPGVFELSRLSGARIFPVGVYTNKAFCFEKSWNKAFLPKPFAKVEVVVSNKFIEVTKQDNPRDQTLAQTLGHSLDDAGRRATKRFATPDVNC